MEKNEDQSNIPNDRKLKPKPVKRMESINSPIPINIGKNTSFGKKLNWFGLNSPKIAKIKPVIPNLRLSWNDKGNLI